MASDESTGASSGRAAVVYVGPPAVADDGARVTAEARSRTAQLGLTPLEPVARTEAEAETLLAAHPDAVIVVHPRGVPVTRDVFALWDFLWRGGTLRLCGSDIEETHRVPVPGPLGFLVVDLVHRGVPLVDRPRLARREAQCRTFAKRLGLRILGVLGSDRDTWTEGGRLAAPLRPMPTESLVVVVHPKITAPDEGTPDGLLWRWLRQGRVIHSGLPMIRGVRLGTDEPEWRSDRLRGGPPARRAERPPTSSERPRTSFDAPMPHQELERDFGNRLVGNRLVGDVTGPVVQAGSIGSLNWYAPPNGPRPTPRDTTRPLPHDGLFIRRNNAFGTRSVLGAKDLIEQGVIIGQEQIRFDDFVAARTDQVPGPRPGEGIAVSHGLAAVQGEFKANEATTHFVEITLKAGQAPPADAPAAEPLSANFVFVVDTSGSMQGAKLNTVKAALRTLYGELRPTDCLGIIAFDHDVRTILESVAKKDLPPERFTALVSGLTAGGGTDIDLGVQYGIHEIGRRSRSGSTVNCLYLFSDGDPTSGEKNWIRIRTNIASQLRGDLTLSCFGFGSDARMPELAALAGLAGGHSTFVAHPEQVGKDLLGDLSRRDHLAAVDIQLKLDIDPEVEIRHLYGHDLVTDARARAAVLGEAAQAGERALREYGTEALPDLVTEEKGIRIFAPDLAFEETYWVVLEIRVPPGREPSGLGTATVQYVDTLARESRRHTLDLAQELTLSEETVTVHAVGLWTSEVTFHALDDLYDRDREAARNRLTRHIRILESAHSRLPAEEFRSDQVTLRKFMTLADRLGSAVSMSDTPHGSGFAPAVRMMNDFGRVRSGFWPQH